MHGYKHSLSQQALRILYRYRHLLCVTIRYRGRWLKWPTRMQSFILRVQTKRGVLASWDATPICRSNIGLCCESSPKSLSDSRDLRHQKWVLDIRTGTESSLSSRSHDHRLYCCPKLIANYLLSKQRLDKGCTGRLESSGLSSWPSHNCCPLARTPSQLFRTVSRHPILPMRSKLGTQGVGVYLVSVLLGTHLTLRQSNSQGPVTYAWKRLSEKGLTRFL